MVKGNGATHVFDYHDDDVVAKIAEAAGGKLYRAFDTASNGDQCVAAMSKDAPAIVRTSTSGCSFGLPCCRHCSCVCLPLRSMGDSLTVTCLPPLSLHCAVAGQTDKSKVPDNVDVKGFLVAAPSGK